MMTAEANQYTARFQSPLAKQEAADPKLQTSSIVGKANRFKIIILEECSAGTQNIR